MDHPGHHEIRFAFYEKHRYKGVFRLPRSDWKVEAIWDDAYFHAAKRLVQGVISGEYLPALEGVAGMYSFRHYLELALKYIIFHSRWLKDASTNARFEEIEDVKATHSLRLLWITAKDECRRIILPEEWDRIDTDFVERCVLEFDAIDPNGQRFRYHGATFGVEKDPERREQMTRTIQYDVCVDFDELAGVIQHVHDVLGYLDLYMVETYGQNEEWESILRSL
jgi:hypothetical protein